MNGNEREWKTLTHAVSQVTSGMCLYCPTSKWRLRWSETDHRWQLLIVHRARCKATRSRSHRDRTDEFIVGLLELHGLLVGHYGEEHLVRHAKVVSL